MQGRKCFHVVCKKAIRTRFLKIYAHTQHFCEALRNLQLKVAFHDNDEIKTHSFY